jgi:exodeoxyribonuclease VII small subunit
MDTPIEDLAFEDALKELELIVGKLESGDTPLQQAIRLDGDGKPAGVRPFAAG